MYSRNENDNVETHTNNGTNSNNIAEIGSSREVEKLLQAFVRTKTKKD